MANPTTLVEYAQLARNTHATARTGAQTTLATAQAEIDAARALIAAKTTEIGQLDREVVGLRDRLRRASVPAEADALVEAIGELQAQIRSLQAELSDDQSRLADAEARAAAASSQLARATAALAATEAELEAAVRDGARREGWKAAVAAPPLSTLRADATAALAGAVFTAAETRIEEIPEKLRDAAAEGFQVETGRVKRLAESVRAAENLRLAEWQANGGVLGMVERRRVEMARAEAALREWAERGRERYVRAISLATSIVTYDAVPTDSGGQFLTEAEAEILADTDTVAAGESAADLRITREEKRAAAIDKRVALDDALATALAPDPSANVSAVPAVQSALTASNTATGELADAQVDYEAEEAGYTAWAAALPDATWQMVVGFLEARAALTELGATDAAALVTAVQTAEANLAGALANAARSAVTLAWVQDQVAVREARLAEARTGLQTRMLSAVRGDA